jgi:RNA-directed DNA polymerase
MQAQDDSKARFNAKVKIVLIRKKACARRLSVTITKLNQIVRGWINYFGIGSIKGFLSMLG